MELSSEDQAKLAQLKRVKRLATAVLLACLALFIVARLGANALPAWAAPLGFVAAFAEAATIGGIADWYAVVVLFRHPMGLKIPHTAIIPNNQDKIASNMGQFIEQNFLSENVIGEKLHEIDFAGEIVRWLGDRDKSLQLSTFIMHIVPDVLAAIEDSGFKKMGAERIAKQINKTEFAPIATKLIDSFVKDGRYQEMLDEIVDAIEKVLQDEATLKTLQKRVADELPTLLYVFQADNLILKRIINASGALLSEVKDNPDHPLRDEFAELFEGYVERMKTSRRFARRVERFKSEIIERPEVASLADRIWRDLGKYVTEDANREHPVLAKELSGMLVGLSKQLSKDAALRDEINSALIKVLSGLANENKSQISGFVTSQIREWDFKRLVTIIEANVGRDLQYIRFNGMLIGGIAGVILHMLDISILP